MTKTDIWRKAVETAKIELSIAEQNFNNADPDLLVAAAEELIAKREKLNALIRMAKRELVG